MKTYLQLKTKVEQDLDLQEETFIAPDEMLGYFNEAIDEYEGNIQLLNEDYFLDDDPLSLVADQADYDLPSDIYIQKLRRLQYDDGSTNYQIKKAKLSEIPELEAATPGSCEYKYLLVNSAASGFKLRILPTPTANETTPITVWYIRCAQELADDADIVECPEFHNFIMQRVKVRCYEKDIGNPNIVKAEGDLERERNFMINTLSTRTDDGVQAVELDTDCYDEHT